MPVNLSPVGGAAAQFFTNNGVILSGGKLYTYLAGTTTPAATYTESSGAVFHANPIILDASGRIPGGEVWLTSAQAYKFVLKDANEVLIGTWDDIVAPISSITANDVGYTPGVDSLLTATNVQDALNQLSDSDSGAAYVGFTQLGTAPIELTALAKMRQIINVKDFGAVGDGVADDTTALQNAFNSAYDNNKNLILDGGTYLISADITVKRQFYTNEAVTFKATNAGATTPTVKIYFERRMNIEGLIFWSVDVIAATKIEEDILDVPTKISRNTFKACSLTIGQSNVRINGYEVSENTFANYVTGRGYSALTLLNVSHVVVRNNTFQNYRRAVDISPVLSFSAENILITDNEMAGNLIGLYLNGTSMNRISKIVVSNNTIAGSESDLNTLTFGGIQAFFTCGMVVRDNTISNIADQIKIQGCLDTTIHNNKINALGTGAGIRASGCPDLFIGPDNLFNTAGSTGYAILVYDALTNNVTEGNTYPSQYTRINNNKFYVNGRCIRTLNAADVDIRQNEFNSTTVLTSAGFINFDDGSTLVNAYDNTYYAPAGAVLPVVAGIGVVPTSSVGAATVVDTPLIATVTPPIITDPDPSLNNQKSYITTFTAASFYNIKQFADSTTPQSLSAWMTGATATLAWNANPVLNSKLNPIVVNGAAYNYAGLEDWWARSMMVIDRYNRLTCRNFNVETVSDTFPENIKARQISEYAWQTVAFRPPLVVDGQIFDAVSAGLVDPDVWFNRVSGRTALGQKQDGTYVLVVVDGRTDVYGVTKPVLAAKLIALGCIQAFNLDGGGSTTLWYNGSVINSPSDPGGQRAISSAMYV